MRLRVLSLAAASAALLGALASAPTAWSATQAKPFPAWAAPTIDKSLTTDQASSIVAERTKPQTDWLGPTSGEQAPKGVKHIIYVSADQSYVSFVNWGRGVVEAAKILGWQVDILNGRGAVTSTLQAMQQAVAVHPDAIITSADASALQGPIAQAVAAGIPVVGIHAAAFPGPDPELNLYDNITSNPAEIGETQAAYVLAESKGTAQVVHFLDNSFAIARFKAEAATTPIQNCAGCKFLGMQNIPIADQTQRIPTVISGLLANDGHHWWGTTCCDNFYPYVAAALRASNIAPTDIKLVGSDGPPSAYDLIRKGDYEVATVPEPSTLFGFQAIDAVIQAMAGKEPSHFIQPTYLVTKANADQEGGKKDEFIPSNHFACHYQNIWLGETKDCSGS
ncbi:substrate-binding domain-containing protein [Acidisoma cellulosilytica]|uniref:Substrate-binding domain-containing protein n=1 Tax=Acidisoma cellulosilyticum TaxID=2802395 RepID=A0A963Z574_9PROT|nr:substrate-binding domain-containing protein [Acidisoma cellulosilyticum]MCB8882260.1 substrate-binding domain-containing protein [Acidisoma cellulosilyticum]